jgi:poly(ADP-ribose) glycohydrolase ARH3
MDLLPKFRGAFLASALGDAIGELAFKYRSRKSLLSVLEDAGKLIYTDDTAMAIALAEYLIENNDLDVEKLGEKFAHCYKKEPWRGYGPGPPKIFKLVEKEKITYQEAANSIYPGGSFGNGSAMRITPAGLFFYKDKNFYEKIKLTCLPTHTHPLAVDGAVILAKAIGSLLEREDLVDEKLMEELITTAREEEFKIKLEKIAQLLKNSASLQEAKRELGNNSTALGSVPFAIYAFLKNKNDFQNGLIDEILISGDRDTVGCMSSALWGAYLGKEKIPENWISKLENKDYIEILAAKLYEIVHSRD